MSDQTNLLTVVNTFLVKHPARSKRGQRGSSCFFCVKNCFVLILEYVKMMIATLVKVMMTTMVIMMKMMMMKMVDEEVIQ